VYDVSLVRASYYMTDFSSRYFFINYVFSGGKRFPDGNQLAVLSLESSWSFMSALDLELVNRCAGAFLQLGLQDRLTP
jgi:predicted small integral membrane protein